MVLPGVEGITYVSVGKEPNGVPTGVEQRGGGPAEFLRIMGDQAYLHRLFLPTSDPTFLVVEEGYDPMREREVESIFTVGNGYLGMREVPWLNRMRHRVPPPWWPGCSTGAASGHRTRCPSSPTGSLPAST